MRNNGFVHALLSGALCLAISGTAAAQAPGSTGTPQTSPQSPTGPTSPTSPANNPDMNMPQNGSGAGSSKMDDKKFVKEAAMGGMLEVELGKVAAEKGSSDDVKKFGQKMVDDHTKANDQLKEAAAKSNIPLPTALDSKHQARIDKMSKLSGPAFDKAYIKDMKKDHDKDVSDFQSEAQNGTDPNIKQFASTTLPVLQEHKTMLSSMGKGTKDAASQ